MSMSDALPAVVFAHGHAKSTMGALLHGALIACPGLRLIQSEA
jgi:hypothetical protein